MSRSLTSLLEAVLETAGHGLQVLHATSSLSTAAGALEGPVVYIRSYAVLPQSNAFMLTYSVSSWHQDIRRKRICSSECGRHGGCIFCRWCESWCVSYQKKCYPWSTSGLVQPITTSPIHASNSAIQETIRTGFQGNNIPLYYSDNSNSLEEPEKGDVQESRRSLITKDSRSLLPNSLNHENIHAVSRL